MIEGDTALTPNQGGTGGSYGIARGGSQLRLAAATARARCLIWRPSASAGRPAISRWPTAWSAARTAPGR